jgi:hypothetical protein
VLKFPKKIKAKIVKCTLEKQKKFQKIPSKNQGMQIVEIVGHFDISKR